MSEKYDEVDTARLYSVPAVPPPVYVSGCMLDGAFEFFATQVLPRLREG